MISIVEYTDSYLNDLTDLFNLWDGMDDVTPQQMQSSIKYYKEKTENVTYLAIDENGKAVGYVFGGPCYYAGFEPFYEIIQIMIKKEHRGKGIGKLLMKCMKEEACRHHINELRLHSRVILTKAHGFYKNLGFKEFKESKFFVKKI